MTEMVTTRRQVLQQVWPWVVILCRDKVFFMSRQSLVKTKSFYVTIELAKVKRIYVVTEYFCVATEFSLRWGFHVKTKFGLDQGF